MARPRKKHIDKQTKRLPPIRCTEAEDQHIRIKAQQAGMTLSEYVRSAALSKKIIVKKSRWDNSFVFQLRKLAVNLNQQTRKFHETGSAPIELKSLWKQVSKLLEEAISE